MLYDPRVHEPLTDELWNVERVSAAIRAIVADVEEAFDDGWPTHPADQDDDLPPGTRLRTVYLGGAGVVDALRRLQERGLVELEHNYVPYLERSLTEPPDFPDEDAQRSLWMGGSRHSARPRTPGALGCEPRRARGAHRGERPGRAPRVDVGKPRHDARRAGARARRALGGECCLAARAARRGRGLGTEPLRPEAPLPRSRSRLGGLRARTRRGHGGRRSGAAIRRRGGRTGQLAAVRRRRPRVVESRRLDPYAVVMAPPGSSRRSRAFSTRNLRSQAES